MSETATPARTAELSAAHETYDAAAERVEEYGESRLEALADAHDRATTLLDRYEDRATGTGDFEGFVEFQESFGSFVESLDDDLLQREAFESANQRFDKRRLSASDFAAARDVLAPARDLAERLTEREEERERYRAARRRVVARREEVTEEVADLERLAELGDADLSAPIDEIREPVAAYNDRVTDAFRAFRNETSAREILEFVTTTANYPLVRFRPPPEDLREYVESSSVGTESLTELTEYAEFSTSKLGHYVEHPLDLKRHVAVHRNYLDGLDARPLRVSWPPPPAGELRYRIRELVSVVGRFAPESVVAQLRELRAISRTERYRRLRRVAVVREGLTPEERTRLAEGGVENDLERARAERDRLDDALSAHPRP